MSSIFTAFKEGPKKEDAWSGRRLIALIFALVFGAATFLVILNIEKVQSPLMALVVLGLPLGGTIACLFLTTWESIKGIIAAWRNPDKEG